MMAQRVRPEIGLESNGEPHGVPAIRYLYDRVGAGVRADGSPAPVRTMVEEGVVCLL
jgi:hypothetical protein